ncbi:HAD family hydrolase [Rhodobacteraceae bacterium]|nr:HAD family hydrolase [Paracoccaceae bacterium]
MPVKAVLFDKDGTLFDFHATWGAWTARLLNQLADGDAALCQDLADVIRFDLQAGVLKPESVAIAGTMQQVVKLLAALLPHWSERDLSREMQRQACAAPQVAATPLGPLLAGLRARGLRLGVVTNDDEASARHHLMREGILPFFDIVIGADSGFGAKPDAGPLLAAAHQMDMAPDECVMVGDSLHDLRAAKAAGMGGVGVLTGPAGGDVLAPHALAVLPSIAALCAWLDRA